jgi:hypothetical protein
MWDEPLVGGKGVKDLRLSETIKGVISLRQQHSGHGSRQLLRSV